jgi:hypothetical protein
MSIYIPNTRPHACVRELASIFNVDFGSMIMWPVAARLEQQQNNLDKYIVVQIDCYEVGGYNPISPPTDDIKIGAEIKFFLAGDSIYTQEITLEDMLDDGFVYLNEDIKKKIIFNLDLFMQQKEENSIG